MTKVKYLLATWVKCKFCIATFCIALHCLWYLVSRTIFANLGSNQDAQRSQIVMHAYYQCDPFMNISNFLSENYPHYYN